MSGQWWESNPIVGPFSNITEANAWAAANPSSLFLGLLAIINGVPYSWGGAMVGWNPSSCGPIYNGTTLPFPTGGDCFRIRAINPAVPKGWSWLEWNGTIWAPPAGEVVAAESSDTYLVDIVATGFNISEFTYVFASSQVVPEYMFPIGTAVIAQMSGGLADATDTEAGRIQAGLTSNMTPQGDSNDAMSGLSIPNMAGFFRGPGFGGRISTRISSSVMSVDQIGAQVLRGVLCLGGPLKFKVAIQPSAVTNRFTMKSYKVVAQ